MADAILLFMVGVTGFEHAKALGEGGEESIKSKALAPPLRSRVTAVIAAKRSPGAFCPTSRFGTPLPPVRVLHTENKKQDGGLLCSNLYGQHKKAPNGRKY